MDRMELVTQWISKEELQTFQDSFYDMTGMNVTIFSSRGLPAIPAKVACPVCDYISTCEKAKSMCIYSSRYGAKEVTTLGTSSFYFCHMGMVEFTVPVYVDGVEIASLLGGQCFTAPPSKDQIFALATSYGFDPEELWALCKKVPIIPAAQVEKAAQLLFNFGRILASNITNRKLIDEANKEIERAGQMKSDFLANMSHEIRTPMNAVIGMADIALQEDMSPAATEYVQQIQNSGKALLHIINDILDYSKISSGKLDIFEEEYDPYIMLRDVFNIIMNRLQHKAAPIELMVSIDERMPSRLIGDDQRIRQVLINIANNAVKFTNEGSITINIKCEPSSEEEVVITAEVIDTGIGIRKEDQARLFQSFSQVDSKRNRNVEGTGLGLAITQQLLQLMHGSIQITSEYGVGSNFTFTLPQKVANNTHIIDVEDPHHFMVAGVFDSDVLGQHFVNTIEHLGINAKLFSQTELPGLTKWFEEAAGREIYLFIDQPVIAKGVVSKLNLSEGEFQHVHKIVLADPFGDDTVWKELKDFQSIKKPFNVVSLGNLFNEKAKSHSSSTEEKPVRQRKFIAPEANVLIVDDNVMNLRVASKLLSMLQITADTASSGEMALEMILKKRYDLIFMDHMMPGLDGIDTTRILHRFHPKHRGIPIIALTANAMGDARKMFLDEGMSDFLAKPIEVNLLHEKLLKWLPHSKIQDVE